MGLESFMNASWVSTDQRLFSNAIALCKGVLHNFFIITLKACDKMVVDLSTQTFLQGHGLRNATS